MTYNITSLLFSFLTELFSYNFSAKQKTGLKGMIEVPSTFVHKSYSQKLEEIAFER
jgi:hypothetical protein